MKIIKASVSIQDLEALGWAFFWDFDIEEDEKENHHVEITVDEGGKTFFTIVETNNPGERSDRQETGDDHQVLYDILLLSSQGKIFKFEEL